MEKNNCMPKRFAHRGLVQHAPENTINAFQAAIDYGCEGIELDVRLSKDGVAIVVHDGDMRRMTDGKITAGISELTAEEIWPRISRMPGICCPSIRRCRIPRARVPPAPIRKKCAHISEKPIRA